MNNHRDDNADSYLSFRVSSWLSLNKAEHGVQTPRMIAHDYFETLQRIKYQPVFKCLRGTYKDRQE